MFNCRPLAEREDYLSADGLDDFRKSRYRTSPLAERPTFGHDYPLGDALCRVNDWDG
jgi:hypothetical protein